MGSPVRRLNAVSSAASAAALLLVAVSALGAAAPADSTRAGSPEGRPGSSAAPRYRLDPVVVTAERLPLPLSRVPADVTVLGARDLDPRRDLFVADALRQVPGVEVQRAGTPGKLTDIRLRGADPRHTLVLYDGIPLNGPWIGSFDFADLPTAGLGRAEIMGGPASSLYGSGAVGGVIQLLPPDGAAGSRVRAFAEYGEEATLRQGATARGRLGSTDASAAVTHLSSSGVGPRDGYEGTTGQIHVEAPVRRGDRLQLSAIATDGRKDLPFDFVYDPGDSRTHEVRDPNNRETDRVAAGRASYTARVSRRISLTADVSDLSGRIVNRNNPNAPGGDYERTTLENTRGIGALRSRLSLGRGAAAVLGAEYRREHVKRDDRAQFGGFPDASLVDQGVDERALYAQAHVEAGNRLFADGGLRVEDHSKYGAYGVPRLSLGVRVPEADLRLRAGYGRAFTAPTLTDLFYPGYGSPTLRPERSRTWEAGADGSWLGDRLAAHVTWHTTDFGDLIQSNSFFQAENIGRARIEGEEISLRVAPAPLVAATLWAAHLVTWNLTAGGPLPKRPPWRLGFSAEVRPSARASLTAAFRWVDPVLDPFTFVDPNGRLLSGPTPGYAVLDLSGAAPLPRPVPATLHVRVGNALDRSYSEVKGYPAPGRTVVVGLDWAR